MSTDVKPDVNKLSLDRGLTALRAEVEGLLRCSAELDRAGGAPARRASVANYRAVRLIGEGGMGEVWEAEQLAPVARRVALKLVRWGMDSRQVLARFEAERQALALMNHPNIAAVYDAGETDDGRPYFAMEYVEGTSLTAYCDAQRLAIAERLRLFVEVCDGVQHAHQKGVIHRDLKPSNILVTIIDGKPIPKVIDFGVAKATSGRLTDESLSTQFGAVVGTLEYMSPEQAGFSGADIDTRADIYSLGVILYELLTGLRPIDAKRLERVALTEMVRIIREEEPSKPSKRLSTDESLPSLAAVRQTEPKRLMTLLRGELDWVVMKCLESGEAQLGRHILARSVDLVVNIPKNLSRDELSNDYRIRRSAIDYNVPLLTNARLAGAFIHAVCRLNLAELSVKSWDEY